MALLVGRAIPEKRWRAGFAWSDEHGGPGLAVRRFRRSFNLTQAVEAFVVYVSADSRYKLWVNGELVGRGPLKGELEHYNYEAYDLASLLRVGENVLAAEVRWFGRYAPVSEVHSERPGFLLQGPAGAVVDTPGEWKVWVDPSVQPDTTPYISNAHQFLGHWEIVDGRLSARGWTEAGFDDGAWERAADAGPADVADFWGTFPRYQLLFPREIPALIEEPCRFVRTVQDKRERAHLFGEAPAGWTLPAGAGGEIVLDAGHLTTGYPVVEFEGGEGRKVEIVYGECLSQVQEDGRRRGPRKAVRDDWAFGDVWGYQDTVTLPGGAFAYEPFHWRTFWFVKLRVGPGSTSLTVRDARYRFTTYPQTLQAEFDADIPDTQMMWEMSWRTLQLCAHETYEDCPYYEQLNYIADTRLQALCSLALAGEAALPRRALRLYHDSVRPDGLVHSRVPATERQILPYFALIWILMIEDYWRYTGDRAFVRSLLNVADGVLWFFRERLRPDGFVGPIPPWSMVDRVPGWPGGEPPAIQAGVSTYLTGLYVCALDAAMRLHQQAGEPLDADRWRALADRLRLAIREGAWSEEKGLFLEGLGWADDDLSQHSQALAILSGAATPTQAKRILERLTTDRSLHRMKFMQSFYLARALEQAGGYEAFVPHVLELWREPMANHLSTWPEYPDPGRSDCHAWSSWIAADLITCVLGVRPLTPGFGEILIAPHVEVTDRAQGRAPTPHGPVAVEWHRSEAGEVVLQISAPEGVPVEIRLAGMEPARYERGGEIQLVASVG